MIPFTTSFLWMCAFAFAMRQRPMRNAFLTVGASLTFR